MKPYKLLIVVLLCVSSHAYAQEPIRNQNSTASSGNVNCIQVGFGFPNRLASYLSDYQSISGGTVKSNITVSVSYDRRIADNLSIGAYLGYGSASWTVLEYPNYWTGYLMNDVYTLSAVVLSLRATYYIPINPSFELYGGVAIGKGALTENLNAAPYDAASVIVYDVHAGGLYYLNKQFGIFGEIGFGLAYLNAGLSVKF